MANQVVWVDIPVLDLDRAMRFYSAVLGGEVTKQEFSGMTFALLPSYETDVSGCLFVKDDEKPSSSGLLIYLNAQGRLDEAVAAVEANGGKVLQRGTKSARTASGRLSSIARATGWRFHSR